jgi:hypothetical protein
LRRPRPDDDDLELHVDRARAQGLDRGFSPHFSDVHVWLLGSDDYPFPVDRRGCTVKT